MNKRQALVIACAALALHACIWAPGQHLSSMDLTRQGSLDGARYQLVPITPKLLAMDKSTTTPATVPTELATFKPEPYRIGVGDSLYITVWEHPELTSPAGSQQQPSANGRLVRADGTLFYPYVGLLKAAGMTVEELRAELTRRLATYVEQPQVDMSVISYGNQRITLRGAFVKTDPLPVTVTPMSLEQAIGAAQVNADQADLSGLVLTRDGHDYHLDLEALSRAHGLGEIWLKAGDQIYLPYGDRKEVYVLGEVTRPAAVPFKTGDMMLSQALGRVGGLNEVTAKGNAVYVIRGVEDMEKTPATIYQLSAQSPTAFALASQFPVHPGDVVFVGPAGVTRWNRFLSQLLPLSGLISNAASAKSNLNN
ncbi:polysaccharide biosynthesis/export family protein [Dyella koreensis]|uniref:Polysaccharide biosynthesis/export family protein n=2 Tax=Dyella koreensis TaxID=311235 RepID=A0ABW8K6N7_9GAMM